MLLFYRLRYLLHIPVNSSQICAKYALLAWFAIFSIPTLSHAQSDGATIVYTQEEVPSLSKDPQFVVDAAGNRYVLSQPSSVSAFLWLLKINADGNILHCKKITFMTSVRGHKLAIDNGLLGIAGLFVDDVSNPFGPSLIFTCLDTALSIKSSAVFSNGTGFHIYNLEGSGGPGFYIYGFTIGLFGQIGRSLIKMTPDATLVWAKSAPGYHNWGFGSTTSSGGYAFAGTKVLSIYNKDGNPVKHLANDSFFYTLSPVVDQDVLFMARYEYTINRTTIARVNLLEPDNSIYNEFSSGIPRKLKRLPSGDLALLGSLISGDKVHWTLTTMHAQNLQRPHFTLHQNVFGFGQQGALVDACDYELRTSPEGNVVVCGQSDQAGFFLTSLFSDLSDDCDSNELLFPRENPSITKSTLMQPPIDLLLTRSVQSPKVESASWKATTFCGACKPIGALDAVPDSVSICIGDTFKIVPSNLGRYKWQWGNGSSGPLTTRDTGLHKIMIYNACDTIYDSVHLSYQPLPKVTISIGKTEFYPDEGTLLTATTSGNLPVVWTLNGDTISTQQSFQFTPHAYGTWRIQLHVFGSCPFDTTITLHSKYISYYLPNAFSPGTSDTLNASFAPVGYGFRSYTLSIYNRWGQRLYLADGQPWRGLDAQGQPLPEGVYHFQIYILREDNSFDFRAGTLHLMR